MAENNSLSEREKETLRLVAQGLSNKEIAAALFISINTVKVHLRNIFEKIDVESRTGATLYAIEHGIIPSPGPEIIPEPRSEMPIGPAVPEKRSWISKSWWILIPLSLVLIIGLSLLLSNSPIFSQPTPTPGFVQGVATVQRWTELAPMSEARASLAAAAYDNAIYAIGGDTEKGVTGLVERYNPQTNSWKTLKAKKTAVSSVSAAVIGGEIYVPGGKLADGTATNVLEVYDPQRDTWQERTALPIPVYGYALASFEGRIYLFGGTDGEQVFDDVYIYDPQQDEWLPGSPMPTARAYAGAAEAGGKIYVIGGWDGEKALGVNEVYVPDRDGSGASAWSEEASMPEPQYGFGLQGIGEIIFLVGKSTTEQYTLLQFLPQNGIWTFFYEKPPSVIVKSLSVVTQQGFLYLLGGVDETGTPVSTHLRYQAVYTIVIPNINK